VSIKIMSRVWDDSPYSGEKLLVLLALADFSNDEGQCFPSVETISKKCRMTERSVFRILSQFVEEKTLSKEVGGGRGVRNTYQFSCNYLNTDKKTGFTNKTLTLETVNPDIGDKPPITPNREEPSLEPLLLSAAPQKGEELHFRVRTHIQKIYNSRFGEKCPWDGSEASALSKIIKGNPSWIFSTFERLVNDRYASDGVNGQRPRVWIPKLADYMAGPLDVYNRPKSPTSPARSTVKPKSPSQLMREQLEA
jgi:hypothetical protein